VPVGVCPKISSLIAAYGLERDYRNVMWGSWTLETRRVPLPSILALLTEWSSLTPTAQGTGHYALEGRCIGRYGV
jgi:hypothetical protein